MGWISSARPSKAWIGGVLQRDLDASPLSAADLRCYDRAVTAEEGSMRPALLRSCLGMALICAGLGVAFTALRSRWRTQAAEARAALAKELDAVPPGQTATMSTQVGALLEAAMACEEQYQGLSSGLSLLHGARVTYVRGALSSPEVAEVVYLTWSTVRGPYPARPNDTHRNIYRVPVGGPGGLLLRWRHLADGRLGDDEYFDKFKRR